MTTTERTAMSKRQYTNECDRNRNAADHLMEQATDRAVKIYLEVLDADGRPVSGGLNATAVVGVERRGNREVTVVTMQDGWRLAFCVQPRPRHPRTVTHIKVSIYGDRDELGCAALPEPRRFARPGYYEIDSLKVEIDNSTTPAPCHT